MINLLAIRAVALVAAASAGAYACNLYWSAKWERRNAADAEQRATNTRATLNAEKSYLNQITKAQAEYEQTQKLLVNERRRADAVDKRLRDAGTVYVTASATDSAAACHQRLATVWELFQDADREAGAMAQAADGHAAEVKVLLDAWPRQ